MNYECTPGSATQPRSTWLAQSKLQPDRCRLARGEDLGETEAKHSPAVISGQILFSIAQRQLRFSDCTIPMNGQVEASSGWDSLERRLPAESLQHVRMRVFGCPIVVRDIEKGKTHAIFL